MTNVDITLSENDDSIRNNEENEIVDLNTTKLLSRIYEIMIYPIPFLEIKDPLCSPDKMTYEGEYTGKWLQHQNTYPITRQHMTQLDMVSNKVIKDIIRAMDNFNIRGPLMKRICQQLGNNSNDEMMDTLATEKNVNVDTLSKAEKKTNKKLKQKANNNWKLK